MVSGIAILAASEAYPSFNAWLQLVPMPPVVKMTLLMAMAIDFGGCLLIEYLCERVLFDASPKIL